MMLNLFDKDKIAQIIVTRKVKPDSIEMEMGAEHDYDEAMKQCANDLISAIESKDASAVVEAFKSMYYCCDNEGEEEEYLEDKGGKPSMKDLLGG